VPPQNISASGAEIQPRERILVKLWLESDAIGLRSSIRDPHSSFISTCA
jgi:hypothetical protein